MPLEKVKIGEQELEIEVKPITLICPAAEMAAGPPIEYPDRVEIDLTITLHHARLVKNLHPEFDSVWRLFMENTSPPTEIKYDITADSIRRMGTGSLHLMGLIDLTLKFGDMKVPVVWKYPESNLHPGWQVALGDLAIFFSNRPQGEGNEPSA